VLAAVAVAVVVVVLAPALEDELAVADDRLLSMVIAEKRKQRVFLDDFTRLSCYILKEQKI
jgi:hypothetical protein